MSKCKSVRVRVGKKYSRRGQVVGFWVTEGELISS